MNNIDQFIKYLDGQLSQAEKISFERLLKSNERVRKEYEYFEDKYKISKSDIETDSRYFSSLTTRAKTRVQTSKTNVFAKTNIVIPGIASILLIFTIIIFFLPAENDTTQLVVEDILFTEELMHDYLDSENFIITENYTFSNSELEDLYLENLELDESLFNFIENNLSPSDLDGELYETLSESEFSSVYNKLEKKKIL